MTLRSTYLPGVHCDYPGCKESFIRYGVTSTQLKPVDNWIPKLQKARRLRAELEALQSDERIREHLS